MGNKIILEIFDHPYNLNTLGSDHTRVWHPLDELEGHVIIKSSDALNIERIIISLEGTVPLYSQRSTNLV